MIFARPIAAMAIGALGLPAAAVAAEANKLAYTVESGKEIRIGIYATVAEPCKGAPVPQMRISRAPTGGKLIVRLMVVPIPETDAVCAGKKLPAQVLFYQSDPGFSGLDVVVIDAGVPGQAIQSQEISVTVGK